MTTSTAAPRELRDYQREAADAIEANWAEGIQRVGVVLPTGSGKSTVIGETARRAYRRDTPVVALAHRGELLDQMKRDLMAVDPTIPEKHIGIVRADVDQHDRPIVFATLQTLATDRRRHSLGERGVILWDECFVAGTLVDGKPIEALCAGQFVTAWSEDQGCFTQRRITSVSESTPSSLVRVTLTDGQQFVCTPGHPFLTAEGWCPAGALSRDVSLHHATASLHDVRPASGHGEEASTRQVQGNRSGVLLTRVREGLPRQGVLRDDESNQSTGCLCADEGAQPDGSSRDTGEGVGGAQGVGMGTTCTGRERKGSDGAAVALVDRPRVGHGAPRGNDGRQATESVCAGHRQSGVEDRRRGGRTQPSDSGQTPFRQAKGCSTSGPRVADVEVLEPGSDGRYGGLCPTGLVYNIEVDVDHTYIVGHGVVVHNCHHAGAEGFHQTFTELGGYDDALMAGFTATMRRDDPRAKIGLGDVIQKVVYEKDIKWAIRKGFLVQPHGLTVRIKGLDKLDDVRTVAGDFHNSELAEVMEAATQYVVDAVTEHAARRQPIIFAASVDAAHTIADALTEAGYPAVCVTGSTSYEDRQPLYSAFRTGETQALVTVQVLTEGADFPMCDAVVLARPTKSRNLYSQMVGRALRLHPGKTDALVLDLAGSARTMKLVNLTQLLPGVEAKEVDEDGNVLDPYVEEIEPLDGDPEMGAVPKEVRGGPVDLEVIDLLAGSDVVWLNTTRGVPFVSLMENGETVFLWPRDGVMVRPASETEWAVSQINTRNGVGGWVSGSGRFAVDEPDHVRIDLALEAAEVWIAETDQRLPAKAAAWRKKQAPSEKQVNFARSLKIVGADNMTKAELSDALSITLVSRYLDKWLEVEA